MRNQLNQIAGLLLATIVVVGTIPSFAAVNTGGDVPQAGTGFGTITTDLNGDNIADTIDDQGNNVFDFLADPDDPDGGAGGLAWDDPLIWVDYETDQNILVGEVGSGSLEINGGSALRYQHLVLGGASETTFQGTNRFNGARLDLQTGATSTADFDFTNAIGANNLPTAGVGVMTVTGFGSTFNNAPSVIPGEFATALIFAEYDPFGNGGNPTPDSSSRPLAGGNTAGGGYDVHVGLLGSGVLNVDSGGAVQIQDALFVGLGDSASGTVTVDGFGSSITAYGRNIFNSMNADSSGTLDFSSIIGGHGNGSLNISNGGRVDMFNGASLGAANSTSNLGGTSTGSGAVLVEGTGSVWNVYASRAIRDPSLNTDSEIALAVGELRDRTDMFPSEALGSGIVEIQTGARVNVTFSDNYQSTAANNSKMVVGFNGKVVMAGGTLSVEDALINDGNFQGYGQVDAGSVSNSTLGSIDAGGSLSTQSLDIQIAGNFNNDGSLSGQGSISSSTFYNGTQSTISVADSNKLRIIATAENERNPGGADGYSEHDDDNLNPSIGNYRLMTDADGNNVVDGADAQFFQANIGNIEVREAEILFGRAEAIDPFQPVDRAQAFINGRFASVDTSDPFSVNPAPIAGDPSSAFMGSGSQLADSAVGTITSNGGTLDFSSNLFNTGVLAFTGGDNIVIGRVLNARIDYDPSANTVLNSLPFDHDGDALTPDISLTATNGQLILPGVILVSGYSTSVTFTDNVENEGTIVVGPNESVANFLGDFTIAGGTIELDSGFSFNDSAAIIVAGDVRIESGNVTIPTAITPSAGMSMTLIEAGELDPESQFTNLDLPELSGNLHWDIVYDTIADEVRLEVVESVVVGADFNGDGVVDANDISVWSSHVGILSGASAIQGDADLDGDVDLDDYLLINQQIVTGVPVAAATSSSLSNATSIPEPSSAILLMLAASGLCGARRRV